MVDSKAIIQQTVDIFKKKMAGTFKMIPGTYPDIHNYEHSKISPRTGTNPSY